MINEKLMHVILNRLLRKDSANITWCVKDIDRIPEILDFFSGSSTGFDYDASRRTLRFSNVTITFITEEYSAERLKGAKIDEVIIDES